MKLYYFETANPRKPCAVARYLNSPVEFVRVDLAKGQHKSPEYLAVNPNGKVPALVDGDLRLWESTAIMAYLAIKAGSDLWPRDGAAQVEVIRWLMWDSAHFSRHAGSLYFENFIRKAFNRGAPNPTAVEESTGFFKQFARTLDAHLASNRFVANNRLSIADFAVATFLPMAEQARLPLADFHNIRRWHDGLMELPAWRDPFPAPRAVAAE